MRGPSIRRVAVAASAVILVAAACGDDSSAGATTRSTTPTDPTPTTTPVPTSTAPTTTPTASPPTTTTLGPADCVARAPLSEVVGQLVVATVPQERLGELVDAIVGGRLGGVVLVDDADAEIGAALAPLAQGWPPPIIAVDEEGGTVQRLAAALGEQPSARALAAADDPTVTYRAGLSRGSAAAGLGFTMVLAPVLDVGAVAGSTSRAFGDDVETVVEHGFAFSDGLADAGVIPVAKHFPGHGAADADSHLRLPSTPSLAELRERDLRPFVVAAESIPVIMIGHLVVPELTDGAPATLSAAALELLREEIGFEGLVMTDDLSMGALSQWTVAEAAELAISAGNDVVIAGGPEEALESAGRLAAAVAQGQLSRARVDEAARRVLAVKGLGPCEVWFPGTGAADDSS